MLLLLLNVSRSRSAAYPVRSGVFFEHHENRQTSDFTKLGRGSFQGNEKGLLGSMRCFHALIYNLVVPVAVSNSQMVRNMETIVA
jgi:hypothetical protein